MSELNDPSINLEGKLDQQYEEERAWRKFVTQEARDLIDELEGQLISRTEVESEASRSVSDELYRHINTNIRLLEERRG